MTIKKLYYKQTRVDELPKLFCEPIYMRLMFARFFFLHTRIFFFFERALGSKALEDLD